MSHPVHEQPASGWKLYRRESCISEEFPKNSLWRPIAPFDDCIRWKEFEWRWAATRRGALRRWSSINCTANKLAKSPPKHTVKIATIGKHSVGLTFLLRSILKNRILLYLFETMIGLDDRAGWSSWMNRLDEQTGWTGCFGMQERTTSNAALGEPLFDLAELLAD